MWRGAHRIVHLTAVAVCLVLAVAGCTSVDTTTPVPEKASKLYACGKLPMRGVELMSGRDELKVLGIGDLGGGIPIQCIFKDDEHFALHVNVDDWPAKSAINQTGMTAPDDIQQRLEDSSARSPMWIVPWSSPSKADVVPGALSRDTDRGRRFAGNTRALSAVVLGLADWLLRGPRWHTWTLAPVHAPQRGRPGGCNPERTQ